jgi:hypothetical protein
MLELMARGGMPVGEVLKLRAMDVDDQKLLPIIKDSPCKYRRFRFSYAYFGKGLCP